MSLNSILSTLGKVAVELAPKIIPAAAGLGSLIKAGEAIGAAFENLKEANGGTAPTDAEAAHQALFERVKAHADSTLGTLEGDETQADT